MNNNTIFNRGDIITHKDTTDNTYPYYYVVLNRFNAHHHQYYNLFCLFEGRETTLRMDNSKYYQLVSRSVS
jgi:hypothetical protein